MTRSMWNLRLITCLLGVTALSLWAGTAGAADGSSSSDRTAARPGLLAPATPTMITFEADGEALQDEPFTSVDNPTVHFIDTIGDDIDTANPPPEADGIGLRFDADDPSAVVMLFDVPTTKLSVLFGNDDPGFSDPGDAATLIVYRNGTKVSTTRTVMNRDDVANQRVAYSGTPIDKARFVYTTGAGTPIDLIEVIDNIILSPVCQIAGTAGANTLSGTPHGDGICGRGGSDTINGKAGNDWISGGDGSDILTAGDGDDLVTGAGGADVIKASDGASGNDTVFAGGGIDICTIDAGDTAVGCETLNTNI